MFNSIRIMFVITTLFSRFFCFGLFFTLIWAGTQGLYAQARPLINAEKGIALQGYDPVAYFTENKAVKGDSANQSTYEGARYFFSSAKNKDAFAKNPSRYAPQYGGWCAFAIGKAGKKVPINPESFKVTDDKLYLFYKKGNYDALNGWKKNETKLTTKADKAWKKLSAKANKEKSDQK